MVWVFFPTVSVESSCKDTTVYLIKGAKYSLEMHCFPNMLTLVKTSVQKLGKY